jgi:ubiquinone/menaquinone biosynthesis C-methylase UbiE
MNKGLRLLGFRLFMPPHGGSVLDVGCGTGVHLEMYQKYQCKLYGLDTSTSMLDQARARLGNDADLRRADASQMPYESGTFDLVISMLVLHEMEDETRGNVLDEMKRVVKPDGKILLIDFHAGKPRPVRGWWAKFVIVCSEVAAGRRHFRNYRHFMAIGGLPTLIESSGLRLNKTKIVGDDTMALYLCGAGSRVQAAQ